MNMLLVTGIPDVVLDPFAGSGSTLKAAAQTGRNYIGIEMDAKHRQTASQRLPPFAKARAA